GGAGHGGLAGDGVAGRPGDHGGGARRPGVGDPHAGRAAGRAGRDEGRGHRRGGRVTGPLAVPTPQGVVVQLRHHRESDLEAVLERSLDPEAARWTTIPLGYTRAMADDYLTSLLEPSPERASWAIEVEGRYAGTIDLRAMPVDGGAGDLGFVTHPA